MADNASTNHNLYDVWPVKDSKGRTHMKARVPSSRREASIELFDWKRFTAADQAILLDPAQLPEWKLAYFEVAYEQFREHENQRKRASKSELDESIQVDDRRSAKPRMWLTIRTAEEQRIDEEAVEEILSHVSRTVASRIYRHVIDQMPFVEIAREENPGADEAQIERVSNTIGRSVQRGLATLEKVLSPECPVSAAAKDV